MAYQPKDGSGALFKNDKGDNANRPDYRGDICINGEIYEIAAWIKPLPSDASKRYMSLSAKPKQAQAPAPQSRQSAPKAGFDDYDDSIPF